MNAPTPLAIFGTRKAPVAETVTPDLPTLPEPRMLAAVVDPNAQGKNVRPALVDEEFWTHHDGVLKAKHLTPGQSVRPFLHGEPRGSVRVVGTVERIEDGAKVKVEWSSGHPTSEHKAAYRFFDASLVGTPVRSVRKVKAFVEVQH